MKLVTYIFSLFVMLPLSVSAQSINIGKDGAVQIKTAEGTISTGADGSANISANKYMTEANYVNKHLVGTDFSGKNLQKALFVNAALSNANLTNADITNADFADANLAGATWIDGKKICAAGSVGSCN